MIPFMPTLYEGELAYSWFARYHVHSGSMTYSMTAEALFGKKTAIPSTEFFPPLSKNLVQCIERTMSLREFAEKHTLLPYSVRFVPLERRKEAMNALVHMDRSYTDFLYLRGEKTYWKKYMRYCPLCAAEDRERYGETFWHREHQLAEVDICTIHRCRLENSSVESVCNLQRFQLIPAEIVAPYGKETNFSVTETEWKIAAMAITVLKENMDLERDVPIGDFLHFKLAGTSYLSPRGENVYARRLYEDMANFYRELPRCSLHAWWQVQKIFCGQNFHAFDICLVANFQNIPVEQLLSPELPEKPLHTQFDERLWELRRQGLTQRQTAETLGLSIHIIKETEEKMKKRLA